MKVAFKVHARQPDIEFVEDFAVRHADRSKQLGLSNLKEANVRAVKNNSRRVDIAPAHTFFDGELFKLVH